MATSKFFSSTFLAFYSKLNPILFLRAVPAPFSLITTPNPLYYELVRYRPVRTPPSRRRKPNAHDDSDHSLPASAAAESTGLVEADMDRSKRKYYRKRQRRTSGVSDSDEDSRRGAGDDLVELKPEVIDFPRLHACEQEHYFYDAFAYPWEKEKHYRMVYQLEKKYFPQYSLEKAFVDPNAEPAPSASAEEGVGKKGRKSGKSKKEKDDGEERDEMALIFFDEKDDEEKEENPADERVTEKKVEEFFKCLRKVPKAGNRPGDVVTADTEAPGEPYLVSRKTELPPRWDGRSGTVVLVDKPKGWISFTVCGKLQRLVKVQKVGQARTLDPMATGLLIVCVGKATKLVERYQGMVKGYSDVFRLREATSTWDADSPVIQREPGEHIKDEDIRKAAASFLGEIWQVPPMFSAIKVSNQNALFQLPNNLPTFYFSTRRNIHTSQPVSNMTQDIVERQKDTPTLTNNDHNCPKLKREKLKGKRAVVRWLKFFRWKKKKDYERMTAEEKILCKLKKAKMKEARLVEATKKIEPATSSESTHDPEILTPEEHFHLLKMGQKCKNYVPIGRRGIFQGVILNMHLHWKKHQTVKVVVKTFTPEEVRDIAVELARLSGGIVLAIHEDTIIMYRGKNYAQPPAEIMSPKVTLSRKKALDKSKYRDALRSLRIYIPKLHQDLEDLKERMKGEGETTSTITEEAVPIATENKETTNFQMKTYEGFDLQEDRNNELVEDDSFIESSSWSETEDLSDIFETDSDADALEKFERPLYLDELEKFPSNVSEPEDFEEHLRQIAAASNRANFSTKDVKVSDLDEVDKIFLRASSLLKKRR